MESDPGNMLKVKDVDVTGLGGVKLGREVREQEFMLRPGTAHLNHGSYGTVPRRVMDVQMGYMQEREAHPDLWFRLNAKQYLDLARTDVAEFVGAAVEEIQLLQNATKAINTVVKSFPFKAGDAILDTTWTYGSINLLCQDFTERLRPDVERVTVELSFPVKNAQDIVDRYEDVLKKHPNIKMAVIDHITSPSSVVMPVKQLTSLCHKYDVIVVIDGAHVVGQMPINVKDIGADFYVSNLHKWAFCPRGSALLYVAPPHASWVRPLVTSWQIGQSLDRQLFDQGTRDHIPLICARNALQFYEGLGGMEKIQGYNSALGRQAKSIFEEELGLTHLDVPEEMEADNLKMLKLPKFRDFAATPDNVWPLQQAMFGPSDVFGILVYVEGHMYFRYSVQIYNDLDDFKAAVEVLKAFIKDDGE